MSPSLYSACALPPQGSHSMGNGGYCVSRHHTRMQGRKRDGGHTICPFGKSKSFSTVPSADFSVCLLGQSLTSCFSHSNGSGESRCLVTGREWGKEVWGLLASLMSCICQRCLGNTWIGRNIYIFPQYHCGLTGVASLDFHGVLDVYVQLHTCIAYLCSYIVYNMLYIYYT